MTSSPNSAKGVSLTQLAAALRARYALQRTLRTRATGTPFRVRWDANSIVITTGAGTERMAPLNEIARSWPLIESGATKTHLKTMTQNASYLESVFDDMGTSSPPAAQMDVAVHEDGSLSRIRDELTNATRQRDSALAAAADSTARLGEVTSTLEAARAQSARDEATIEELRATSATQSGRIAQLRSALDSAEAQVSKDEAAIERLRAAATEQADGHGQSAEIRRLRANLDSAQKRFESDQVLIKQLRATIATDRAASDGAVKDLLGRVAALQSNLPKEEAVATINELRAEVERLKKLRTAPLPIELNVDGRKFMSENPIHPDLLDGLREAAKLSMQFPGPSIGASRKVLEAAIRMMWQASKGEPPLTDRVADMLYGLRHDPLIPDDDWHLAKNIYSRASAFVHGKTPRADVALWIFFGTVQFCELVPLDLA